MSATARIGGSHAYRKVYTRSKARFSPGDRILAQVLCAPPDVLQHRDLTVGRYQRRIRWIVNGNLEAPQDAPSSQEGTR